MSAAADTVWIPAVPVPFLLGVMTNRCMCGEKFRGRGRGHDYEMHWRRVHERDHSDGVMMEVPREKAARIYEEVAKGTR